MKFATWAPLVVLAVAPHAYAQQDQGRPDALVRRTIDEVMSTIQNNPAAMAGDPDVIASIVEQKFLPYTDFLRTTRLAAGSAWAKATPEQQKALFEQFQTLLVRTYAAQLTQVREQGMQFKVFPLPSLPPSATDTVVKSQVVISGDRTNIDYRLYKSDEGWKIYDINMMGAWMIELYRKQFAQQMAKGGIDGLIRFLTAHNKPD